MRTCPKCHFTFNKARVQHKTRHCPTCGAPLFYQGKDTILLADKLAVDEVMAKVSHCIEIREGVIPFPDAKDTARERKFAYDILARCKVFLERNKALIEPHKFFVGLFEFILNNPWWEEHIKSILQLKNAISKLAVEYYSELRSRLNINQSLESSHLALAGTIGAYAR